MEVARNLGISEAKVWNARKNRDDIRTPGDETKELCREVIWWHNQLYGHEITLAQVRSKTRVAPIVAARADCMRRLREVRGWSYPVIGKWFGGFDHTTVMHHTQRTDAATKPVRNKECLAVADLKRKAEVDRWRRVLAKTQRDRGMAGANTKEEVSHENP